MSCSPAWVRAGDLAREAPALLALNNAAVPNVNALAAAEFTALAAMGSVRVVAGEDGLAPRALMVTLPAGASYKSLNYLWFAARYDDFLYVDRIVVAPAARGLGLGRALYEDAFAQAREAGCPRVLSEVNIDPPNPGSLAFHRRLGFGIVAERRNAASGKGVAMMVRDL